MPADTVRTTRIIDVASVHPDVTSERLRTVFVDAEEFLWGDRVSGARFDSRGEFVTAADVSESEFISGLERIAQVMRAKLDGPGRKLAWWAFGRRYCLRLYEESREAEVGAALAAPYYHPDSPDY